MRRILGALPAAAALAGCILGGSPSGERGRSDWDMRLIRPPVPGSSGSPGDTVEFFLNAQGRIERECRLWSGDNCTFGNRYRYDAAGRWIETIPEDGGEPVASAPIVYASDSAGRTLSASEMAPDQRQPRAVSAFVYGADGRLERIDRYLDFIGGRPAGGWALGYDADGRLDSMAFDDGLFTHEAFGFAYDSQGRLQRVSRHPYEYVRFERDAQGRIAKLIRAIDTSGEDAGSRLLYRNGSIRYEPEPLRLGFMGAEPEYFH